MMNFGLWIGKRVSVRLWDSQGPAIHGTLLGMDEGMLFFECPVGGLPSVCAYPATRILSIFRYNHQDWVGKQVIVYERGGSWWKGTLLAVSAIHLSISPAETEGGLCQKQKDFNVIDVAQIALDEG